MIFRGLFFAVLQAQLVEEKECFTPPLLRNFDLAAYSGMWWSLASYPARYHTENSRCTRLFYDLEEENDRLYVNNTSIRPDDSGDFYLGWTQGELIFYLL
jgi:lipocalin